MSIHYLNERLLCTMLDRYKIAVLLLLGIVGLLVFNLVSYYTTHSNEGVSIWSWLPFGRFEKNKLSIKEQIGLKIIAIALILILMIWWAIPAYNDIANQQYAKISTQYTRSDTSSKSNWLSNGHVYVKIDGNTVVLDLPYGWTATEFPEGTLNGVVYYSIETRIILAFVMDSTD